MPKFKINHDVIYSFRVSRVAEGSFRNLWSLDAIAPGDKEWQSIIDADSLSTVIDRMQFMFESDGF